MLNLSVKEKIFLSLFFITLVISVSEYVYMNNHSVSAEQSKLYTTRLLLGYTPDEIAEKEAAALKKGDGMYSPVLQLWITGIVSCIGGLWFCMLISLEEDNELRKSYVDIGNILLFWVIVIELILFLWKILK